MSLSLVVSFFSKITPAQNSACHQTHRRHRPEILNLELKLEQTTSAKWKERRRNIGNGFFSFCKHKKKKKKVILEKMSRLTVFVGYDVRVCVVCYPMVIASRCDRIQRQRQVGRPRVLHHFGDQDHRLLGCRRPGLVSAVQCHQYEAYDDD